MAVQRGYRTHAGPAETEDISPDAPATKDDVNSAINALATDINKRFDGHERLLILMAEKLSVASSDIKTALDPENKEPPGKGIW